MDRPAQPKISVIIPVRNGVNTIEKAIQSILAQNYSNLEIIVMDGASTDGTLDILKKYQSHLSHLESAHDGNPSIAVNKGLAKATGDIIAQLMCDDYFEDNLFHEIAFVYQTHPEADIISCGGRLIYKDTKHNQFRTKATYCTENALALTFKNICYGNSVICCRFIKRSLYEKIGVFLALGEDGKVSYSNDKEFLLRAVAHGAKNVTLEKLGYTYVAHEGSATFSGNRKMTARLYFEHRYFARLYLNTQLLTKDQRNIMHLWYYHQSARLVMYLLFKREFKQAWSIAKEDLPQYPIRWPLSFIWAPFDFAFRRLKSTIDSQIKQLTGSNIIHIE